MIPQAKKRAAALALYAAFGTTEYEDIKELTAGLSTAVVYRIVVKGKPYVLRIIMRDDVVGSLANQYRNMRAAAEAGIAPQVWYTGIEDKISIVDYIEPKPFPLSEALVQLPELLSRLHALPAFPPQVNYLNAARGFVKKFSEANVLPENLVKEISNQYARMDEIYPRNNRDIVPGHNDTKADNIIFDGLRPWLVDWEASFPNDRYVDLAIIANFTVWNDDDERKYLSAYFNGEVSVYQHARFFLMRQMMHIIYTSFLLAGLDAPAGPIDPEMDRPGFREFHDLLWAGKLNVNDPKIRRQYGLVHLDQVMQNLELKRFEEALRLVSLTNGK